MAAVYLLKPTSHLAELGNGCGMQSHSEAQNKKLSLASAVQTTRPRLRRLILRSYSSDFLPMPAK
jgi:hypothetical protein